MIQTKKIKGVDVSYTIADPKLDDIYAAFKIGSTVKELGQSHKADIAADLNYANNDTGTPIGRVIADGKTVISDIPKTIPRDELYMLPDKSLHIGKAPKGVMWALQGSPPLLRNGKNVVAESIKRDQLSKDIWQGNAFRLAVGLTADRRLVIARTKQTVTLDALAAIMADLGCVDALNGDGGGSAYLWPADSGWGRKMGAALIIKKGEVEQVEEPILEIDPGHGGTDPGAIGNGIIEKDYTLKISLYQFERFKELGVPVALTRDNDRSLDSIQRTNIVKDSGAKYCISNHINAATSTDAAGAEIIHSIHNDGKLALGIANGLRDAGQILRKAPVYSKANDSGGDYFFMQRLTGSVMTLIVEYGFCTNAADAKRLKENWETYAEAVVKAYCLFIGHKYTPPEKEVIPPVKPPAETGSSTFKDVPSGHYSEAAISWAKSAGLVGGYPDGTLGFGENITIERLLVILNRFKTLK